MRRPWRSRRRRTQPAPTSAGAGAAAAAQPDQPGNNAPVWREVQRGEPNYTSIPGREMNVLIQPPARFLGQEHRTTAGEAWRQFRNGPITFYGGWLVVLVLVAILAFYFTFGPVKLHDRPTGRHDRSASPARPDRALVGGDQLLHPRPDRADDAVRQARAAAGHRLHAVRLAHQPGQEPAQLRRAGVHGLGGGDDRALHPRTTCRSSTTSSSCSTPSR